METFNEENPKYRCCCQCMHVRTGALIIGLIHSISVLMAFIRFTRASATIYNYTTTHTIKILENDTIREIPYEPRFKDVVPAMLSGILLAFSVIAVACMFWGVCKNRSKFLIPELVFLVSSMIFCILSVLFFIVVLSLDSSELNVYIKEQMQASGYDDMPDTVRFIAKIVAIAGIVVFLISLVLTYWFYRIVRNTYYYLKEKESFLNDEHAGARYAVRGGSEHGNARERQPIVIIQPPSSGADGNSPPPPYPDKY